MITQQLKTFYSYFRQRPTGSNKMRIRVRMKKAKVGAQTKVNGFKDPVRSISTKAGNDSLT